MTLLLNTCCINLYGSVVWDLNHVCIAKVCVAWCKSIRRVWGLPADTHCELLPVICDSIPILVVVFCHSTNCINCCLNSSRVTVSYVTRHGVFFFTNAFSNWQYCITLLSAVWCMGKRYISIINSGLIIIYVRCHYSDELISRASALLEFIFITEHSFNLRMGHSGD